MAKAEDQKLRDYEGRSLGVGGGEGGLKKSRFGSMRGQVSVASGPLFVDL